MYDNIQGGFLDHLEEVNRDLEAAGLPSLESHGVKYVKIHGKKQEGSNGDVLA